jgi:hypothetical protein
LREPDGFSGDSRSCSGETAGKEKGMRSSQTEILRNDTGKYDDLRISNMISKAGEKFLR